MRYITQLVECRSFKPQVVGSNPTIPIFWFLFRFIFYDCLLLINLFYYYKNGEICDSEQRVYINGRLFAFQAKDEGSNPSIRKKGRNDHQNSICDDKIVFVTIKKNYLLKNEFILTILRYKQWYKQSIIIYQKEKKSIKWIP